MKRTRRQTVKSTLEVDGAFYPLKIHYETRRNCAASIRATSINIRIPAGYSQKLRADYVAKMTDWAVGKLRGNPNSLRPQQQKVYSDGDTLDVGGHLYSISISLENRKTCSARIAGDNIRLKIPSDLPEDERNKIIPALISRCIARKRLPELEERIRELNAKHFNADVKNISFKNSKTRWGSCSRAGNINISTRLLFAPDDVIEYVCIHELAHLIEHNHSPRFWALVAGAAPEYKDKRRWLRNNGRMCEY
ncbi:MAG: SprT family zinc-dependent metalloprotease [bacterium]